MSNEDPIRITYYNPMQGSNVIAIFGCHCVKMDLYMSKLRLIKANDGGSFISWPNEDYIDPKTGKKAFSNFCWFGKERLKWFQETVLKSIKEYCERKGINLGQISEPKQQDEAPAPKSNDNDYGECPF